MFGCATLVVPSIGRLQQATFNDLPDDIAIGYARIFGRCLSDDDDPISVTLSDGQKFSVGFDTIENRLMIGRFSRRSS